MTTPNDDTPLAVINDAMHDAGYLQKGQVPNGEDIASNMRRLRDIINFEMTQGIKLFLTVDTPVVLTAGTGLYSFGPNGTVPMVKPEKIIEGYYMDSNGVRRQMIPLSWDDYIRLGQVNQQGPVSQYLEDRQPFQINVTLWLIPDTTAAAGTVHLLFRVQATNPVTLTETVQFPPEWRMFLRWALAEDISTGQPTTIMTKCSTNAERYRTALEAWDVEEAPTSFQPDPRGQYAQGRFR